MTQYFVQRGDKVHGPFSEAQLKAGLKAKKLSKSDLFSTDRRGPWRPINFSKQTKPKDVAGDQQPETDILDWLGVDSNTGKNTSLNSSALQAESLEPKIDRNERIEKLKEEAKNPSALVKKMTEPMLEERITRKKNRKLKILSTIIAFPVLLTIVVFVWYLSLPDNAYSNQLSDFDTQQGLSASGSAVTPVPRSGYTKDSVKASILATIDSGLQVFVMLVLITLGMALGMGFFWGLAEGTGNSNVRVGVGIDTDGDGDSDLFVGM